MLANANGCIKINIITPDNAIYFFKNNGFTSEHNHVSIKLR